MTEKSILPPTYFFAALVVSLALHFLVRSVIFISFPFNLIGIVLIAFGAVLNIWADQVFKKRGTTVKPYEKPSVFVAEGPFSWCRHPMYLGMLAILVGVSIICGSVISFLGPLCFWSIVHLRFEPIEERSMLDAFGDQYMQYKNKVHSWI